MLPLLFAAGLLLSQAPEPAPAGPSQPPPPVVKRKHTVAVPDEETKPAAADANKPKAAPKAAPRPAPKKTAPQAPTEEQRKLAESQAAAAKLINDNALLQQEMAKAQGLTYTDISSPDIALAELLAGNVRFASGKRVRTLLSMQDAELRATLAKGEAPFAVIVSCSDSRVSDSLIFDQELGRLFSLRDAGNAIDTQVIASIEYALQFLGAKLVLVLGHTNCGAVKAVQEAHGKPLPGNLWALQSAMAGLVEGTPEDPNETNAEYGPRLVAVNAQRQAQAILARSEFVRQLAASGKVKIISAMYDMASGQVRVLETATIGSNPTYH
jgi:carbonic anhydrase